MVNLLNFLPSHTAGPCFITDYEIDLRFSINSNGIYDDERFSSMDKETDLQLTCTIRFLKCQVAKQNIYK